MNGCCILEHQRKRKTPLIMQGILEKDLKLPRYVQREILNGRGLAIRYEISEIYLKRSVFSSDSYGNLSITIRAGLEPASRATRFTAGGD